MPRVCSMFALLSLAAGGCSEFGLGDRGLIPSDGPDIVVEPSALQFGTLRLDEEERQTFTIRNEGTIGLDVSSVSVAVGFSFELAEDPGELRIPAGESVDVEVVFSPRGQDENFGQIIVASNDPDTPEANVDLLGMGQVPDLVIDPPSVDFGQSFVPCGDTTQLTLRNEGADELLITGIDYGSPLDGFTIPTLQDVRDELPMSLLPGESAALSVVWEPEIAGVDLAAIEVWSNDPGGVETAEQLGEGLYAGERTDSFTAPTEPAVDVVFLIDQSCSMQEDNETTLTDGLPGFFAKLRELSDWQLIQVTRPTGCANGGIIDANTPNAETQFANNAFGSAVSDVVSEALLELASVALGQTGPTGCNAGALRSGALLHIIVASDEPEQSGTNWATHVADFERYVSDPSLLRVSGIVDINSACGIAGSPTGPGGYSDAANNTGGMLLDICSSTWGSNLDDLAEQVLQGVRSYELEEPAAPASISVLVNGVPATEFSYSEETQSVTVTDPPVEEGDVVEISYGVAATCR